MTGPDSRPWQPKWVSDPPGATLLECLDELGLTQTDVARRWRCTVPYVNQLVHGRKPITPPTAVKLERLTGVAAIVWLRLEAQYRLDLYRARRRGRGR